MQKFIIAAALVILSSSVYARDEQKVYKWVDADGNIYYGDSVPVEFRERPKEILNEHGVTIESLEGKKTPEQLEQERKENAVRLTQELQQRADLALLQTYLTVDEIEMHRDRRVELFQAQSRVTELYLRNLESRLQKLRDNASRYQPYSTDSGAPMIDDRDAVTRLEPLRSSDGALGWQWRSAGGGPKPPPGVVRIPRSEGSWTFRNLGTKGSHVVYESFSELGGSIPAWIINWLMVSEQLRELETLRKVLNSHDEPGLQAAFERVEKRPRVGAGPSR